MARRKSAAEWALIEAEWRTNTDSIREIADRHDVSEAAIRKRAKAEDWGGRPGIGRSLAPFKRDTPPPATAPPSDDPGEIARRGLGLVDQLIGEVAFATAHQGELEELIDIDTAGDEDGRRRQAMFRALGTAGRAATLKALAGAFAGFSGGGAPMGTIAAAIMLTILLIGWRHSAEYLILAPTIADFIGRYDRQGALFYLDPPYWNGEDDYGRGIFERADHTRLAEQLSGIRGRFVLSINDTPGARAVYGRFDVQEVETTWTVGQKVTGQGKRVTELIVTG